MITRSQRVALMVILCISFSSLPWAEAKNRYLSKGISLIDQAEDEQAITSLQKALKWKGSTPTEITQIHLYLGIAHFNLLQKDTAAVHFKEAIKRDPQLLAPDDVSPLIVDFFADVKRQQQGADPKKTPTQIEVYQPPSDQQGTVPEVVTVRQHEEPEGRYWPGWLCLSVAVAAGGTGIAMGVISGNHADDAKDPSRNYNDQMISHEKATDFALAANILYGVAGASAVAAAILFYVGMPDKQTTAQVVPLQGGAMVQLNGFTW